MVPAKRLGGKSKYHAIGTQRIGALNAIFAKRYGGQRENYVFPDDDAGREDLTILLHHYALNNPLAMPRIIGWRAPRMSKEETGELIRKIEASPKWWTSGELGRVLGYTGAEWRELRTRTIAPIDMTKRMRRRYSSALARDRKAAKRRERGITPRFANITNTKPWEAFGISRATWFRWGKPVSTMRQLRRSNVSQTAMRQLRRSKVSISEELVVSPTNGLGEQGCCQTPGVKPLHASVLGPAQTPASEIRPDQLSRADLEAIFMKRRKAMVARPPHNQDLA